jgi:hypothetical protein
MNSASPGFRSVRVPPTVNVVTPSRPKNGFVELVVAVRRGHARISGGIALEDADTASGLVCVDVKTDGESPDLDRLGSGVRHGVIIPAFSCAEPDNGSVGEKSVPGAMRAAWASVAPMSRLGSLSAC